MIQLFGLDQLVSLGFSAERFLFGRRTRIAPHLPTPRILPAHPNGLRSQEQEQKSATKPTRESLNYKLRHRSKFAQSEFGIVDSDGCVAN